VAAGSVEVLGALCLQAAGVAGRWVTAGIGSGLARMPGSGVRDARPGKNLSSPDWVRVGVGVGVESRCHSRWGVGCRGIAVVGQDRPAWRMGAPMRFGRMWAPIRFGVAVWRSAIGAAEPAAAAAAAAAAPGIAGIVDAANTLATH